MKRYISGLLILLFGIVVHAQDKPIGYWEAHMPYNTAKGVATDGQTLYVITDLAFFTVNKDNLPTYSKVEGMSDVGMSCIAYDGGANAAILAYSNSNIDIFKDNTFYNIPDLKNKSVSGNKAINQIYIENSIAYLSTDIGIQVLDINKREIRESYVFNLNNQLIPISGFYGLGNYFYAITPSGLFKAGKNNPELQNFAVWQNLDKRGINYITAWSNKLYVATTHDLYTLSNDTLLKIYSTPNTIKHLDTADNGIWISEFADAFGRGIIKKLGAGNVIIDTLRVRGLPTQVAETIDSAIWVADEYYGFCKKNGNNSVKLNYPNGPSAPTNFDIYVNNKEAWVAHGGYTDLTRASGIKTGFSSLKDKIWYAYTYLPEFVYDSLLDFVSIIKDPNGIVYAGSFQNGLFVLNPDGTSQHIQAPYLGAGIDVVGYPVAGMALDESNTLWVSMMDAQHNLVAKTKDGTWYNFSISDPVTSIPYPGGPMLIDDYGQKWIVGLTGGGVMVYNDNNTIQDPSDDQVRVLSAGVGAGNLPSNTTICIAKDKNGDIWIGTNKGIGIVNCGGSVFQGCDGQIPVVQYDQYAGHLFATEIVRSIAVDGANRKWVGTDNGVWLLTPDAGKIVSQFNVSNSPLPSNHIQKIAIDPVTGDVYIGTDEGLITYHGTATDGGTSNSNVVTYPNPVPSGYAGTIAIKGLVANGNVRITDISGQLIYKTTALGGQAIWNGRDYTGHRPQSGVYMIFVSSADGSQTYAGKMVFLQ
ncbi:MAG: T9SS type A sorting domain-containing protein [Taibaiella sp.]|nr:T9SS type A sorting domain-containing protein [Taibaiella sp.]